MIRRPSGLLKAGLAIAAPLAALTLFVPGAQAKRSAEGAIRSLVDSPGLHQGTIADSTALPYSGGPVLHWNRTHLVFWQPSGSSLTFDPGYESLIETFLRNVAVASRSSSNVFGLTGQYTDHNGPAAYVSVYGGAVDDTDPLPANGCTEPASGPANWTACVTDAQLQHELEHVVSKDRLPTGSTDVYFMVTPNGLGDCNDANGTISCALGGDINGYCGYHSNTTSGLLYAVIPYNAVAGHCQSDAPRPNGTADPSISTISHELSEMITDPLGAAWIDSSGDEMGDLCLTNFGPNIDGSTGPNAWNEDINGSHYYLQEEWSNHNGGCEPRAKPDSVSFQTGSSGSLSVSFRARGIDPQGKIISYRWSFGDGRAGAGGRAVHRYGRAGRYRVVLHAIDSWGNAAYYAATLSVGRAGAQLSPATNAG
jgi:hypothetical protein